MILRKVLGLYLALLLLSLFMVHYLPPPAAALSSGLSPLTRFGGQAFLNVKRFIESLILEQDLKERYVSLLLKYQSLESDYLKLQMKVEYLQQATQIQRLQSPALVLMAPVIGFDPTPLLSRFVIRAGKNQGVTRFMTATTPAGLVGQVISVSRNESVVLSITDPEARVGIAIGKRSIKGTAMGVRLGRLRAELPKEAELALGDRVITSSLGGVFPAGIAVGTVDQILPAGPNALYQVVLIRPLADFANLETVGLLRTL